MPPKVQKSRKQLREEAKAKEREDARIKEEQDQKKREEDEKIRLEMERLRKLEEERLSKEERERLFEEQNNEMQIWRESWQSSKQSNENFLRESTNWDKWLQCSSNPDPIIESEVTTFISEFKEQKKISKLSQVLDVLSNVQEAEEVVNSIRSLQLECVSVRDNEKQQWCEAYIRSIRQTSQQKLNEITSHLTVNSDIMIEEKALENVQKNEQNPASQMKSYKQDDSKTKQEIIKVYNECKDVKYAIWINPNQKSGLRRKPNDFSEIGVQCEVPRPFMSSHLIMRVVWTSQDFMSEGTVYKDIVMGGVLNIECYQFLPQPKKANNWTIKHDYAVQDALKKQSYPASDQSGQINYSNVQPVKVYYILPSYLYIHEKDKPRVAVFDKDKGWTSEHIDELKFDTEKKQLTFNTNRLAPIAYIQERCTDYPYQSFKLRCIEDDKAILDIQGKRQQLKFEIGSGYVMLLNRNEPELAQFKNNKMTPGNLIKELQICGINLLPVEKDFEYGNIPMKDTSAEENAIESLGILVRAFFIKSCRWSGRLPSDRVLVQIHDNLEFDSEFAEDQEKDWVSVCVWKNKCGAINAKDSMKELDDGLVQGTVTHSNIELLLAKHEMCQPECLGRVQDTTFIQFIETLRKFLRIIRLIAFTYES